MKNFIIPELSNWKKDIVAVAFHGWGDDYDTQYSYSLSKNALCKIWHEEEQYGNDTHGWQAGIETKDEFYRIASKRRTPGECIIAMRTWIKENEALLLPETRTHKELRERLDRLIEKRAAYNEKTFIKTARTSIFIGCDCCGSKLKRELLKSNTCPLCHSDLRSKTVQDALARMDVKIKELSKKI